MPTAHAIFSARSASQLRAFVHAELRKPTGDQTTLLSTRGLFGRERDAALALARDPEFKDKIEQFAWEAAKAVADVDGRPLISRERMALVLKGDAQAGPFLDAEFGALVHHWGGAKLESDLLNFGEPSGDFEVSLSVLGSSKLAEHLAFAQEANATMERISLRGSDRRLLD